MGEVDVLPVAKVDYASGRTVINLRSQCFARSELYARLQDFAPRQPFPEPPNVGILLGARIKALQNCRDRSFDFWRNFPKTITSLSVAIELT